MNSNKISHLYSNERGIKIIGLLKFLHIYSSYNFKRVVLQKTRLKSLNN